MDDDAIANLVRQTLAPIPARTQNPIKQFFTDTLPRITQAFRHRSSQRLEKKSVIVRQNGVEIINIEIENSFHSQETEAEGQQ